MIRRLFGRMTRGRIAPAFVSGSIPGTPPTAVHIDYLPRDASTIDTVAEWIHVEWAHLNPDRTRPQLLRRLRKRAGSRKIPLTLVAIRERQVVGTASLLFSDMDDRRPVTPWLGAVYVLPAYRGRGIGRALCERIEAEARRLELGRLYLFTEDRQEFYRELGWRLEERCQYRGYEVVVMAKDIGD